MVKVSASEAAYLVNRHERIVRGRIKRGELPATKERNAWRIEVDDLERIPGWHVDRGRLAQLEERSARSVETMAARLASVERELRDVRARLRALELRGTSPPVSDDAPYLETPESHPTALLVQQPPREAYIGTSSGAFKTHADAARWLARHGVRELTPKTWPGWRAVELTPAAVLRLAISLCDVSNHRITWRLQRCDDLACICGELLAAG